MIDKRHLEAIKQIDKEIEFYQAKTEALTWKKQAGIFEIFATYGLKPGIHKIDLNTGEIQLVNPEPKTEEVVISEKIA